MPATIEPANPMEDYWVIFEMNVNKFRSCVFSRSIKSITCKPIKSIRGESRDL